MSSISMTMLGALEHLVSFMSVPKISVKTVPTLCALFHRSKFYSHRPSVLLSRTSPSSSLSLFVRVIRRFDIRLEVCRSYGSSGIGLHRHKFAIGGGGNAMTFIDRDVRVPHDFL